LKTKALLKISCEKKIPVKIVMDKSKKPIPIIVKRNCSILNRELSVENSDEIFFL
jgi:hypothetical protein